MTNPNSKTYQHHLARADSCRLLSACYYEPDKAFLEEDIFGQLERALSTLKSEPGGEAEALGTCFREADQDALLLDYTRLFLGPFNILAKPYGSIYLDGDQVIMGDSTMAVMARYREGGFQIDESFSEVPDHVAVELEFLYLLNARLGNRDTQADQRAHLAALKHSFLSEHLGRWVTPFTEAMESAADSGFYQKVAALTRRLVLDDLQETAAQPRP